MKIFGRFRFSLASLLLIVLLIASLFGMLISRSEVERLQQENKKLRLQQGELDLEDPSMVYIKRQVSHEDLEWRWRIYLPAGHAYHLRMQSGQMRAAGFPKYDGSHELKPLPAGEFTLVVRLFNNGDQKGWVLSAEWGKNALRQYVKSEVSEWMDNSLATQVGAVDQFGPTFHFDPAENDQVELCRVRKDDLGHPKVVAPQSAGFLIWLETEAKFKKDNPNW